MRVIFQSSTGNVYNNIADYITKNAVITAHQDPSYILELSHTSMQSRLQFKFFWKDISWDGCLRKNLSVLSALPYCADWAHSKPISPWFDNEKNNTVPLDLLRIINNVVNIDRIYFSPGCYIRWDYTWYLLKSYVSTIGMAYHLVASIPLRSNVLTICYLLEMSYPSEFPISITIGHVSFC